MGFFQRIFGTQETQKNNLKEENRQQTLPITPVPKPAPVNMDVGYGKSKCPICGLSKSPSLACPKCFPNVGARENIIFKSDEKILEKNKLIVALGAQDIGTVKKIIFKDPSLINVQDFKGITPLMLAVLDGDYRTADNYIKSGANLELRDDNNGRTALMFAAINGDKETAELLIKAKADVNVRDNNGSTALMLAILFSRKGVAEVLINNNAYVNIQDNKGSTALMYAASSVGDDKEVTEALIKNNADITIRDFEGKTALLTARARGRKEMEELLINATAVTHNSEEVRELSRWEIAQREMAIMKKK